MTNQNLASLILRIGLAFVFIYAAIAIYIDPAEFEKYLPPFMLTLIPKQLFFSLFFIFEIALALWLLWGKGSFYSGLLAAAIMGSIMIFNPQYFSVLFRNVAIMSAGLALAALSRPSEHPTQQQPESPLSGPV